MNKLFIIGNVTHSPELKTVSTAKGDADVCTFTVAVNRRAGDAQFFRVTTWRQLAQNCSRYLDKGRKVSVVGEVSARTYTGRDGETRVSLELAADEVEFLSPRAAEDERPATGDLPF